MSDAQSRWEALMRQRLAAGPEAQAGLAPAEHGAYAEWMVNQNPLMALPLTFMVPGYAAAKGLGALMNPNTTPPSLDQMAEGYRGIWRGLTQ